MALPRVTGSCCHCGRHRKPLSLQWGLSRAAELAVPAAQSLQRLQGGWKPHPGVWGVPKPQWGLRTSPPEFLHPSAGIRICCPTKTKCPLSSRATETHQLQQGQHRESAPLPGSQQHHKFQPRGDSHGQLLVEPADTASSQEAEITDLASLEP